MDDNSSPQSDNYTQQHTSLLIKLPIVKDIFKWLSGQIGPTEEEQEKAGVYLGGEGRD